MSENMNELRQYYDQVKDYFDSIIVGESEAKNVIISALLSDKNSRMLFVGNTGACKTVLAKSLASNFKSERITMIQDMLPSEVQKLLLPSKDDVQCILLEEFNRVNGRVQSSLIELMEENQMTIDRKQVNFPPFFYVIATQNIADITGIFTVSQAIYDRFDINVSFGNLSREEKKKVIFDEIWSEKLIRKKASTPLKDIVNRTSEIIKNFTLTETDKEVLMQIADIVDGTTLHGEKLFSSTNIRAHQFAVKLAKMQALIHGRDYILPDDLVDFISNIYLHCIDQNVVKMFDREAQMKMEEIKGKVLDIKRPKRK